MGDQEHAPLLVYNLIDGSRQRIQAAGEHHHLLRHPVYMLGVVELEVLLELMILVEFDEIKLVLVVGQEAERRAQRLLYLRAVPEVRIAHRYHKVQVAPPPITKGVDIVRASSDHLIGAVDVGGDLQQVMEQRWHATKHFGVDILDPQGDVAVPGLAREPQPQIARRIFADAFGGRVAAQNVSFTLHRCAPLLSTRPSSFSAHSLRIRPTIFWKYHRPHETGALRTTRLKTSRR